MASEIWSFEEKKPVHAEKKGLVSGFDYDISKEIDFCEPCVSGKIHRRSFRNVVMKELQSH